MHDIEKLKADLAAAHSRLREAEIADREAGARITQALGENSGLIGHVVQYNVSRGWGKNAKTIVTKILVHWIGESYNGDLYAHGKKIIASGEVGVMDGSVKVSDATDMGVYTAP